MSVHQTNKEQTHQSTDIWPVSMLDTWKLTNASSFAFFTSGYITINIDRDLSRWLWKQDFMIYHDFTSR